MRFVVDTSVLAKVFVNEPEREHVVSLLDAAMAEMIELHAPSLLMYEINNVLVGNRVAGRRYDDAIRFLFAWIRMKVLNVHEVDEDLLRRAEAIASIDTHGQGYISSYDAMFQALAHRLDAVFVTADERYIRKTQGSVGRVEPLANVGRFGGL